MLKRSLMLAEPLPGFTVGNFYPHWDVYGYYSLRPRSLSEIDMINVSNDSGVYQTVPYKCFREAGIKE